MPKSRIDTMIPRSFAVLATAGVLAMAGCMVRPRDPAFTGVEATELTRPHDDRTFTLDPEAMAFEALPGATAFHGVHEGIHGPAGYRIEVPDSWNGVLVMFAHGFRGTTAELRVTNPAIREHLIRNGYAWAASTYSANYYDVRAGIEDTNALALAFSEITGLPEPRKYYITGRSMGGHIAGAAVERETLERARNRVRYAGAVPMCGVMGDVELYAYFLAFNIAAHQLAGFPPAGFPITKHDELLPEIQRALWLDGDRTQLTPQGERLKGVLMNLSGGPRPVFDDAFAGFLDQLFGYGSIDGTANGITAVNIANTASIVYQFDADPALSPAERAFNETVLRVHGDVEAANPLRDDGLRWIPRLHGQFDVPVVSVHTLGDLFVPFSMQQIYARRAARNGSDRWLVQRAIRAVGHCEFTVEEEAAAFDAMVRWEVEGIVPEGDDILDPESVAAPDFGCAFTTTTRRGLAPCPGRREQEH